MFSFPLSFSVYSYVAKGDGAPGAGQLPGGRQKKEKKRVIEGKAEKNFCTNISMSLAQAGRITLLSLYS